MQKSFYLSYGGEYNQNKSEAYLLSRELRGSVVTEGNHGPSAAL